MGHTNSTTNYNLPQFITTDKPAWLTDINGAFSDIDSAINTAQSDATTAGNNATQALSDASAASTAAATADSKGAGAVASIADAFDSTTVYSVGDYVMYNSLMYVCSVAVVTPGPWTGSANWTRVTVESVIDNLTASDIHYGVSSNVNTELGNINTALSEKSNLLTTGTYSNTFTVAASADVAVDITITKAGYTPIGTILIC